MHNRTLISELSKNEVNAMVAGRVVSKRKMKRYHFYDLRDASGQIQLICDATMKEALPSIGDIISAVGNTMVTETGHRSIKCSTISILSRSSLDVVNAFRSGKAPRETELRAGRSLNLLVNEDLHNMVKARSVFIDTIRDHFKSDGFIEVDTPVMSYARFAGTASVFQTRSRTLEKDLYLRGTLEDYLKQLVVAGYEKVFQVGDCFRNESPALLSFTMLEATWAYASSDQMLDLVRQLIAKLCESVPDEYVDAAMKDRLSQPIETVTFWDALDAYFARDIRECSPEDVKSIAAKEGYAFPINQHFEYELAKFGYDVIKRKLANSFEAPTFVSRFPACISPLAREINDGSGEADRGYGFFNGQRLFEVVEEASDHTEQLGKFQAQDNRSGSSEYSFKHDDLLKSLSYGCPPMAGLGFNVNRVLAVMLNATRTSDVMAFPLTTAALPL